MTIKHITTNKHPQIIGIVKFCEAYACETFVYLPFYPLKRKTYSQTN